MEWSKTSAPAPRPATQDERERTIISLRSGQEMIQSEIGQHLGISQIHISRTLTKPRTGMLTES